MKFAQVYSPFEAGAERFKIDVRNQSTGLWQEMITIRNGNVGIGAGSAKTPTEKLVVNGKICAKGMRITANACWADYVFSEEYELMPLVAYKNIEFQLD